jgi:hypothetical protein
VLRTRNPAAYRLAISMPRTESVIPTVGGTVPEPRRELVAETAGWLHQHPFDPTTARVAGAYDDRTALYGPGRRVEVSDPHVNRLFASLGPTDALLLFARQAPARALARPAPEHQPRHGSGDTRAGDQLQQRNTEALSVLHSAGAANLGRTSLGPGQRGKRARTRSEFANSQQAVVSSEAPAEPPIHTDERSAGRRGP